MIHRQTPGLDCSLHGTNSRADPLVDVYVTVGIYKERLGAAKSVRGGVQSPYYVICCTQQYRQSGVSL